MLFTTVMPFAEPAEADAVAATNPIAARLLETWRTIVPPSDEDGTGDFEDFFEMAARLDAAVESKAIASYVLVGRESHVRVLREHPDVESFDTAPVDLFHDFLQSGSAIHYGPLSTVSPLNLHLDSRADRYHQTKVFADHAGRDTATGGYFSEPDEASSCEQAIDLMAAFAQRGHREVIVKHVRAKHGLWRIPTSTDPAENLRTLTDALGWSLIGLDGTAHGLGIQQVIPMTYEYRIFIVNGHPVTGAGCIEEHTPLDADETAPFSPLMRARRPIFIPTSEADLEAHLDRAGVGPSTALGARPDAGFEFGFDDNLVACLDEAATIPAAATTGPDGPVDQKPHLSEQPREPVDPIESRPDLVAIYLDFATAFAAQAIEEDSLPTVYVLDVAISNDQALVVEVNALSNSGLYAAQPVHVTRAMVEAGVSQTRMGSTETAPIATLV